MNCIQAVSGSLVKSNISFFLHKLYPSYLELERILGLGQKLKICTHSHCVCTHATFCFTLVIIHVFIILKMYAVPS